MMIDINDIKNGMTVIIDGQIYQIVDFLHVKPGKGSAFMKMKLKNLRAGTTLEKTMNTNIKLEKANITKVQMSYLYSTGDEYVFMDMNTYEQVTLPEKQIEDEAKYLKENLEVELVYFNDELLGVNLPDKIDYKVVSTTGFYIRWKICFKKIIFILVKYSKLCYYLFVRSRTSICLSSSVG